MVSRFFTLAFLLSPGYATVLDPAAFSYCNVNPEEKAIPTIQPDGLELKQLQVFIRHGDRIRASVGECWPNDDSVYSCDDLGVALASSPPQGTAANELARVYRKEYVPGRQALPGSCGLGYLTSRGYNQQVSNAAVLQAAYGAWLPDLNTNPSVFQLRSTDSPRTIQSGQALVDALFPAPPLASNVQQRLWQTIDGGYDSILEPYGLCPYAKEYSTAFASDPDFEDGYQEHVAPVAAAYAIAVGNPLPDTEVLPSALDFDLDCALTHACDGYDVPSALNASLVQQLVAAATWEYNYALQYDNRRGLKANVGFLLADSASTLETAVDADAESATIQFALYSGHDTGPIGPLMSAFGVLQDEWPTYASLIVLEVWAPSNAKESPRAELATIDAYVRVLFQGDVLPVPGCNATNDGLCPFSKFLDFATALLPTEAECAVDSTSTRRRSRVSPRVPRSTE